jgi:hypothetical protein
VDVVYICRDGANEELRYSLRSLTNLDYDRVWVVGGAPDWYHGDRIVLKQRSGKYDNARNNLRALCNSDKISESFVLMNDDFFIVKPVPEVPVLHGGDLLDKIRLHEARGNNSAYVSLLWETVHILAARGCKTNLDYALHVPMVMSKGLLGPLLEYKASLRSLYGNLYHLGGEFTEDVKYHPYNNDGPKSYDFVNGSSPFLSTSDRTFPAAHKVLLKKLFPDPSVYELV